MLMAVYNEWCISLHILVIFCAKEMEKGNMKQEP